MVSFVKVMVLPIGLLATLSVVAFLFALRGEWDVSVAALSGIALLLWRPSREGLTK